MLFNEICPPRLFQVGKKINQIFLKDVLHIKKISDQNQILFKFKKKILTYRFFSWGFFFDYDLKKKYKHLEFVFFGNNENKIHLALVDKKKYSSFKSYCKKEDLKIIKINKFINEI